jgi:RNA polymerase sigma-70 factor (ECF subfamily)
LVDTDPDHSTAQPPADLSAFCAQQWPRLVGTLSLLVSDASTAEDLAQEALVRLCRDWKKVRDMDRPGVWLHRVAVNLARSHGRRQSTRTRLSWRLRPRAEHVLGGDDPTSDLAVRGAVMTLPERERLALVLRYFADLPVRDTAVVMGCAEGTVKFLTHSAIDRLRASGLVESKEETDVRGA